MNRRHLSREQRRALIAESLRADPELPDSEHATRTGASDKTVSSQRKHMEAVSEIPKLDYRVGKDGKQYPAARVRPASQPSRPEPEPEQESDGEGDTHAPSWEPAGNLHANAPQAP